MPTEKDKVNSESLDLTHQNLKVAPALEGYESLTFLNLSFNNLSTLPTSFSKLVNLKTLFLQKNNFEEIPEVLKSLPKLFMLSFKSNILRSAENLSPSIGWLILTDNKISSLPSTIGSLTRLQKCMLSSNLLTGLPESLGQCKDLELLRLSNNKLKTLPSFLLNLPRLSWIALADNPFMPAIEQFHHNFLDYNTLVIGELLGEGTSGNVYALDESHCLKVYKSLATSDGLSTTEIAIMESLGDHPNLITNVKRVKCPGGEGVVMKRIGEGYKVLGNPPSFLTITRDTFPPGIFDLKVVKNILEGVADAMMFLHQNGVSHGDLYAHNILHNNNHAYLTDFGAGFSYKGLESGELIEKVEVRAFGCLVDDLIVRSEGDPKDLEALGALRDSCSFSSKLPSEIELDNKYYKTRLLLNKSCSNPSLVLHCTEDKTPDSNDTDTAVLDFSGVMQSKCIDSGFDWIDASGNEWMNDLIEYLDCFPWPQIDRHGETSKSHMPLPLGLLNAGFNSDSEEEDIESKGEIGGVDNNRCDNEADLFDDEDPYGFEKTLKEFTDIKAMASANVDNRAELADRIAKAFGLHLGFDED